MAGPAAAASRSPGRCRPGSARPPSRLRRPTAPPTRQANGVERRSAIPQGFCQSTVAGATTTACRLVPDVRPRPTSSPARSPSSASPGHGWTTIGGTSSAAPIWAACWPSSTPPTCTANRRPRAVSASSAPFSTPWPPSPPIRGVVQRHHRRQQRPLRPRQRPGLPGHDGYDMATGLGSPQLTGPDGSAGLASYLCSRRRRHRWRPVVNRPLAGRHRAGGRRSRSPAGLRVGRQADVAGIQVGSAALPAGASPSPARRRSPPLPRRRPHLAPGAPAPGRLRSGGGDRHHQRRRSSAPVPAPAIQYVDPRRPHRAERHRREPLRRLETGAAPVTIFGAGFTGATRSPSAASAPELHRGHSLRDHRHPARLRAPTCAPLPTTGVFAVRTHQRHLPGPGR